ncbi:MAG: DNA integrity scanning protein DisA nucleotide-binding domain protein [Nitrospinae bacterium]|nr:DNA integrity scanning protein DisA nucleotide-binding domain protein [Nitrospinota bacterium]
MTTKKDVKDKGKREIETYKKEAEEPLNKVIIESAGNIAARINASTILLCADMIDNFDILRDISKSQNIIFATRDEDTSKKASGIVKKVLIVPNVNLTRVGQIKIAIVMALSAGIVGRGDKLVCISGIPRFGSLDNLDNIMVLDIGKEFEVLTSNNILDITVKLKPEVFETVLNLAVELANQGREGKAVGAMFVIGDEDKVLQFSRQMIINPFKGYPEKERNVMDPDLRETIREFSVIDGAFIIREDGIVVSAGRHLNVALEKEDFPRGLGSRHIAAAGITSVTDATAIVISESTGTVRIFKNGMIFMEIEKSPK